MSVEVRTSKIGKPYTRPDKYEKCYGNWVQACHKAAMGTLRNRCAQALQEGNLKVLDVGIGTGLTIPEYPEGVDVTGIDVNADMLQKAEEKISKPKNSVALCVADATDLPFADNAFDVTMALEVINTIHEFEKAIAEIIRVTRGMVIATNTFPEDIPIIGPFLSRIPGSSLFTERFGFHTKFRSKHLLERPELEVMESRSFTVQKRTKTSRILRLLPRLMVLEKNGTPERES